MHAGEWQDFHNRFMHLADKQKQIVRATRKDLLLGHCSFADPEFEGDCCVLPTLESARLELSKGPDELLKARFETVATAAGQALGCPKHVQPLKFWLYSLFMHLRRIGSRHLLGAISHGTIGLLTVQRPGGIITDVCEASAIFCARLERRELEDFEAGGHNVPAQPVKGHPFDQNENLRNAILKKKARIVEIERILNHPPITTYRGHPVHGGQNSRLRLEEERQHLLLEVAELERERERLSQPSPRAVPVADNSDKTAQIAEREPTRAPDQTALLSRTWEEILKRSSITQNEAAGYLQCNAKTVRRLVKDRELKQSAKKRIICDEQLRNQIRRVHGPHVLP